MEPQLPAGLAAEFRHLVLEDLSSLEPIDISCVVSGRYAFDFAILYESLVQSWTFFPFRLHAFVFEPVLHERLSAGDFEHAEIHLLEGDVGSWMKSAVIVTRLPEDSGLERSIVTDVDNVFVAETPELSLLLNEFDLVFVGAPQDKLLIQTSLWAFKRTDRTREFGARWFENARGVGDQAGLAPTLLESRDAGLKIKVLAKPKLDTHRHLPAPYDIQANIRPFVLTHDELGFGERQMGRAKVIHLGGLRARGIRSVSKRLEVMAERFPELAGFLPLYARLANGAARRLGREVLADTDSYVRELISANQNPTDQER